MWCMACHWTTACSLRCCLLLGDEYLLEMIQDYGEARGVVQGNREHIDGMASGSQKVLQDVLKLIDTYDLYGSVAYPKQHQQSEISDIYRLPLATRGVFTNVALQEPFGLTVIEVQHSRQCLE